MILDCSRAKRPIEPDERFRLYIDESGDHVFTVLNQASVSLEARSVRWLAEAVDGSLSNGVATCEGLRNANYQVILEPLR